MEKDPIHPTIMALRKTREKDKGGREGGRKGGREEGREGGGEGGRRGGREGDVSYRSFGAICWLVSQRAGYIT